MRNFKSYPIAFFLIVLSLPFYLYAQESNNITAKTPNLIKTAKIDEFVGVLNDCDLQARLDAIFYYLQENPDAVSYIVMYNGADQLPANQESGRNLNNLARQILKEAKFRELDDKKIVFLNGGFREKFSSEIWIVPNGESAPKFTDTISKPLLPTNKTFLYDSKYLFLPYGDSEPYELLLPSAKAETNRINKEFEFEVRKLSKKNGNKINESKSLKNIENEDLKFFWADKRFGESIKNIQGSMGEIIFYADNTRLDINKIKRYIKKGKLRISSEAKIPSNKIKISFGGYRNMLQAEFWIIPKGGDLPMPSPKEQ